MEGEAGMDACRVSTGAQVHCVANTSMDIWHRIPVEERSLWLLSGWTCVQMATLCIPSVRLDEGKGDLDCRHRIVSGYTDLC